MATPPKQILQDTYNQLLSFYDLAEELIDTVEHQGLESPLSQFDFIEPLVERVEEATDVLTEEYRYFAESGKEPSQARKDRIENALGNIFDVLNSCGEHPSIDE